MRLDNAAFIKEVKGLYLQAPGKLSSIAYWKLEDFLSTADTFEVADTTGARALYAIRNNQLIFYWSNQSEHMLLTDDQLSGLDFLVLHEDYYNLLDDTLAGFNSEEGHCLFYDFAFRQSSTVSEQYYADSYNFDSDADYLAAAEIITSTNTGYTVTAERVRSWTNDKGFDPSLWIMVRERQTDKAVGVGISCYYEPVRETDLDWFFVDPGLQGQGIGRLLIAETIARCQPKSSIIRLAGIADGYYTKCGFRREDKWFYIRRNKD